MIRWWKDLAVSKKLYAIVGVLALLIATELLTLLFAMDVLSSLRSFVAGEGLWSKGQKNAALALHRYADTGNAKYYLEFDRSLEFARGDHEARVELEKPRPDESRVIEGFVRGGNERADVPGIVRLVRRFPWAPYLREALQLWRVADLKIIAFTAAGEDLHHAIQATPRSRARVDQALARIDSINDELTQMEMDFSNVLGRGSHALERLLILLLVFAVLTVESTGLALTVLFSRSLSRGLRDLMDTAAEVGRGNFEARVTVRAHDEIGQLGQVFNKMIGDLKLNLGLRREAETASESKSRFLAHMSHEIRTPLNVILGLTEVMREGGITPEARAQYVDTIERTGKNLLRIVNDVLDLSKVEANHLEIENARFALADFIAELEDMMQFAAEKSRNLLVFNAIGTVPAEVVSDRTRLRQVLVNLVGNALKYTVHGRVTVSYWQDGAHLSFEISDTGPGIRLDQHAKIFEAFARAKSHAEPGVEGTGLGLALARSLARALGGDLQLKSSALGKGSTFLAWIRPLAVTQARPLLPVHAPAKAEATAPAKATSPVTSGAEPAGLSQKRVLVVEDSTDNQLLIKLLLTRVGIKPDFAMNGQEAVDRIATNTYDIILMDMQMPIKDGYAATRELRDQGFTAPIIAITAHAMKEDRARCLEAGCTEYLTKPLDSRILFETLTQVCKA